VNIYLILSAFVSRTNLFISV